MCYICVGGVEVGGSEFKAAKFLVIGHRGSGMNILQSSDSRMKTIKENSILSFNAASNYPIDYVEFDVQVPYLLLLCSICTLPCLITYVKDLQSKDPS